MSSATDSANTSGKKTSANSSTQPDSFEKALAELEHIVAAMENSELPLEQALQNYQRGLSLLQQCRSRLEAAEQRIQVLENGELTDYSATAQKK